MRTILDLSDPLHLGLPAGSNWYTEKQLVKEFNDYESIGYAIWDDGNSVPHVGLVPSLGNRPCK